MRTLLLFPQAALRHVYWVLQQIKPGMPMINTGYYSELFTIGRTRQVGRYQVFLSALEAMYNYCFESAFYWDEKDFAS